MSVFLLSEDGKQASISVVPQLLEARFKPKSGHTPSPAVTDEGKENLLQVRSLKTFDLIRWIF